MRTRELVRNRREPGGGGAFAPEQGAVDNRDRQLAQALQEGNARYEARFGRVF